MKWIQRNAPLPVALPGKISGSLWIRRNAPPRVPPRVKIEVYADVVELVDSLDLGSNARACRFESCHPHQQKAPLLGCFFVGKEVLDSNPSNSGCPVDIRATSSKTGGIHNFLFAGKENVNRVLSSAPSKRERHLPLSFTVLITKTFFRSAATFLHKNEDLSRWKILPFLCTSPYFSCFPEMP